MISILIISWNTCTLLRRCLITIFENNSTLSLQIIIVDNGSSDGTTEMLQQEFPQVTLIISDINLGFTKGNNVALEYATGDYIMLLNPDTEIVGNALELLLTTLKSQENIGVVGPLLLLSDGTTQNSGNIFPRLRDLFTLSIPLPILSKSLSSDWFLPYSEAVRDVDWVIGAAVLIKREVYEKVGGLDEQFFMYFEETDWEKRIHLAGWRVVLVPNAHIIHHTSAAGNQVPNKTLVRFNKSRILYTIKWYGVFTAELLRLWIWITYIYQILLESLKWLINHRRPLRKERIISYRNMLIALYNKNTLSG